MQGFSIKVIPYPIDVCTWAPVNQRQARKLLGFREDIPFVLFGAVGGTNDSRKGSDLLLNALMILRTQVTGSSLEKLELMVFGQSRPASAPRLSFPIHYCGCLQDDISLRLHYAAADVVVVPSRQEAFGQTASEAQACGTPVVAFNTGGLVDVVNHGVTGVLAEPFDPASLAASIRWVLEDNHRRHQLSQAARQRAVQLWNPVRIAGLYANAYNEALLSS